jgi:hypothetical protein
MKNRKKKKTKKEGPKVWYYRIGKRLVKIGQPGVPDPVSSRLFLKNRETGSGLEPGQVSLVLTLKLIKKNI